MRCVFVAILLACAPLTPAAADVDDIDVSPLLECVEAAGRETDALRACQGAVSAPCFDAPGGETTSGMVFCLGAEGGAWERVMAASLARLAAGNSALSPALAQAQSAWSDYREAECSYRVARWGLGSGARVTLAACYADLAADRAISLVAYEAQAD